MPFCDACDHFGYFEGVLGSKSKQHDSVFIDTGSGRAFCVEHVSEYVSWLLDGGMVDEPDMYAWVEADTTEAERPTSPR